MQTPALAMDLADSEVARVLVNDGGMHVYFSAAAVRQVGAPATAHAAPQYAPAVLLTLSEAQTDSVLADCVGSLAAGRVQLDGHTLAPLTLPLRVHGHIGVDLQFRNGAQLYATASALSLAQTGPPVLIERLAC